MKSSTRDSWLICLLFFWFTGSVFAQRTDNDKLKIKKLKLQISKETNDTSKVKLLIALGSVYSEGETEQDSILRIAYDLSMKYNFRYGLAYGKYYEGLQLSRIGRDDEALERFKNCIDILDSLGIIQTIRDPLMTIRFKFGFNKQAEKFRYYTEKVAFYKKHGPVENTANCFHAIAGYYNYMGNIDKSIEYYLRARDVFRSFDSNGYANEEVVVGAAYMEWGNFEKAEVYLQSSLKYMISLHEDCFYSYNLLGILYYKKHDYKLALQYHLNGRKYASGPEYKTMYLINCATIYLQLDSIDRVRSYLDSAELIRQKETLPIAFPKGNIEVDYTFYKYYIAIGDEKSALRHLLAALQEAESNRTIHLVLKYNYEISLFFFKKGDSLLASRYMVRYHFLHDSVNTMNTRARIASFEIEQQQQQKENKILQLQTQKATQRNYYLIGGVLLLLIVLAVLSRLRYKRKRDKEQLTTDFKKQLAQAETKALRSQMNPHFIFNSLNSINNFVTDQKHELASDYLLRFSKLIRLILDNSRSETIPLDKELETLQLYVQLESIRFDNHFDYAVNIDENTSTGSIMIPPMLLQPFIENAIWHGLMQKRTKGTITVDISKENEKFLHISITDDGIGREKAAEMKSKSATHRSHGLKVTSERIDMMNKLNSTGAQVHIVDLKDEQGNALGTKVELVIPF